MASPEKQGVKVNSQIWKACAGSLVKIPAVNTKAYYFPQGHVEQSQPPIPLPLPPNFQSQPSIPCLVQHVSFLADPSTDEVFAKILLSPLLLSNRHASATDTCRLGPTCRPLINNISSAPHVGVSSTTTSSSTTGTNATCQSLIYNISDRHVGVIGIGSSSSSENPLDHLSNATCQSLIYNISDRHVGVIGSSSGSEDTLDHLSNATCRGLNISDTCVLSGDDGNVGGSIVSFAKVLTPSDANNGGGFSVPRFCADAIFPPLDFGADPPVQNIRIRDVHGKGWEFRHIYRGTPRRHLLTTGWSKFVNSKRLVAGDSVVFMRDRVSKEMFVGVRRAVKGAVVVDERVFSNWGVPRVRNNKGGVGVDKVLEAVDKALRGEGFEVVYCPKNGAAEFVVGAERVEEALGVCWDEGVRVKMAMETEDSSRLQWFQGTVVSVSVPENGVFRGSTWKMLEVKWDEPEILKNMNKVSPWQVEFIPPTPPIHTYPPTKKVKYSTNSGLFDGEEEFPLPSVGFNPVMGSLGPSFLNHNSYPAGMQGARQSNFFLSNLPSFNPENHVDSALQRAKTASIDLNIGKTPSATPSPDSQNSVQLFGTRQESSGLTRKAGITSFQLFGKTIHMEQPLNSIDEVSCTESDDRGAGGTGSTMDHQLTESYKKLHDKLGTQCQSPPVEGYVNG